MKSRTKKSRKHFRRSAVASMLVLSSCLVAAQAYATDVNPNSGSAAGGTLNISNKTVTVNDGGSYGLIKGSEVRLTGNGTAIAGGNTVSVTNDTSGGVMGGHVYLSAGGTASSTYNTVTISGGTHANARSGFVNTYGACTNEASNNYMYLTNATLGTGWMSTGDASAYNSGASDVDSNNNHLIVSGGSAGYQYVGGYAGNYTTAGGTADASSNTISITDSSAPIVIAGYANLDTGSGNSNANSNTLTISGSKSVITNAYSGYAYSKLGGNVNANSNINNKISGSASIGTYSAGYATTNGNGTVTSKGNSTTVDNATVTTYSGG
ncbi:MAG: hypothetical protein Q3990_02605, partial [Desulfovibrionaceae bacterium]|nr:hypothetical protein [Desulfovibrionaceae bacterium]